MGMSLPAGGSLEGAVPATCLEEASPVHTQSFLPPVCGSGFSVRENQMWINDAEGTDFFFLEAF